MSEEDKGISYKMEGPGQDILLEAPPYAVKNRLHSQANAVETQRSASCKHSYHFPYHCDMIMGLGHIMRYY